MPPGPFLFTVLIASGSGLLAASGQPAGAGYRVVTSTHDGGTPQTSSHAPSGYRVRGTVGQPDAATSSAGAIRVEGGFWSPKDLPATGPIFGDGFETP